MQELTPFRHETGHALKISSRDGYDPLSKKRLASARYKGHDLGLFPEEALQESRGLVPRTDPQQQMKGLMYFEASSSSEIWTRHEDWKQANLIGDEFR